jgi:DNA-binding transcriptional LysR family regulator
MALSLTQFDLNLLVVLDALLTEKSVTRAAERLFVTQPAVSGSLARLRDIFEDPLLVRVGREMELTVRARALAGPVREALLMVKAALGSEESFDPAETKCEFRIAMTDYCSMTILPRIVRELSARAPGIELAVEGLVNKSFDRLETGEIDFLLTVVERTLLMHSRHPDMLRGADAFEDCYTCVVAADHPFDGALTPEDFRAYPNATVSFGENTFTTDRAAYEHGGLDQSPALIAPSFSSLLFQLQGTTLIGTVPNRLAEMFAPMLGVRLLEPPIRLPTLTERLNWHVRSDADPGHRWMRNLILDVGRSMGPRKGAPA